MNIIYLANVFSDKTFTNIFDNMSTKPQVQIQKYHKGYINAFSQMGDQVYVFNHNYREYNIQSNDYENNNKVEYTYLNISNDFNSRYKLIYKKYLEEIEKKFLEETISVIICDMLNYTQAKVALYFSKKYHVKLIGILTDHPSYVGSYIHNSNKVTLKNKIISRLTLNKVKKIDIGLFATEKLQRKFPKIKKTLIIDGLTETKNIDFNNEPINKNIILYAGVLSENYGVKMMVDSFCLTKNEKYRLHIYGSGHLENYIKEISKIDSRVKYFGFVKNDIVYQEMKKATLLVNPRPIDLQYVDYSFPSKIIEYMTTGIPIVTTKFSSLGCEYYKHVYFFKAYDQDTFKRTIETLLEQSTLELHQFGLEAQRFIYKYKSNLYQVSRIKELMEDI